jgi:hypothetical protein
MRMVGASVTPSLSQADRSEEAQGQGPEPRIDLAAMPEVPKPDPAFKSEAKDGFVDAQADSPDAPFSNKASEPSP